MAPTAVALPVRVTAFEPVAAWPWGGNHPAVPPEVERTDPDGVDYGWVMQMTFVVTILAGAPLVAVLSLFTSLPTWGSRVAFAIRVGAVVWLLTAIAVYVYARRYRFDRPQPP